MGSWLRTRAKRWWSEHLPPAIPSSLGYAAPAEETEYTIDPAVFHEGHEIFRERVTEITGALLKMHPRPAAEIAIEAEPYVMPDHEPDAYDRLVEEGMTIKTKEHIWGETAETHPLTPIPATSNTIEDGLTLFPYTHKAVAVDENAHYLFDYYESGGTYRFWLPDGYRHIFGDQLSQEADSVILDVDEWVDEAGE